ncbi:MAG: CoA ester lyase [Proteobacteria bacterium]|jgi:(S)-citramalyl-CoA lyase|nr:CoA ester lyase [Pseudomonadota bacterium]MDB4826516.1 CoA ester lyase [Gammaproteobacteria bacterium]MBT4357707.1 CoA ester lyase [Pseudomonadota bacterium]MBT4987123.1 CoA ester lyase [Pseudomonadota bacterium]MBT5189190.1 CoA ester lyase [Pseudomonadota bacterium]
MTEEYKQSVQSRRSFIFAPGLRPELYPKALASGADIVCVELEDGIAPHDKDEAREKTLTLFAEPQANDGVERIVRINCLRSVVGLDDVKAILATETPPPALMLPKVVSPDEVVWLDDLLTERGRDTRLHIIIEMNAGLEAVFDIARSSSRIDALFFGGVDMAADLRCKNAWEPLLYARSRVVHAAASVGVDAVDVPYLDLEDLEGMKIQARQARDLGFSGKGAIHPKQIADLNEVFTPSAEEVARARKVVTAFEEANTGLVVVDGKLIEKPVVREMQRILSVADRAGV